MQLAAAGQAVEVLAVTADQTLLATLREAVGEQQRIWHANTPEQAVELIMAGQVGVVVLDTLVTVADSASFCERLRAQFPDLVLVVAGSTEDQTQMVKHITSGDIYRFLHKPVSTARARQFIETGVRRHLDGRTFTPTQVGSASGLRSPFVMVAGIAAAVIVAAVVLVTIFSDGSRGKNAQTNAPTAAVSVSTRAPEPAPAPAPVQVPDIKPVPSAPPAAPAPAPASSSTSSSNADGLLKQAEAALLAGRLDEAAARIDAARRIDEDHAGLAFLSAQLGKERDLRLAEQIVVKTREAIAANDFAAAEQGLTRAQELKASPTLLDAIQRELQGARTEFTRKEEAEKARAAAEKEVADSEAAAERERQTFLTNVVPATSIPRDKQVQPVYPPSALNKGIEGWVEMDFTVTVDGRVKDIELRDAQPQGVFEQAARTAVAQWRYKPIIKDGRPVEQRARVRLRFAVGK